MHPKNPFQEDYDFNALMGHYKELSEYVFRNEFGNQTINFGNKHAVKALNTALLKKFYNVNWDIPDGNLCPPIPGRLDYLLYLADLIKKEKVHLLDIGTGANLIYPILASCHFKWNCTASEVDRSAFINGLALIERNEILRHIDLRQQKFKNKIFEHLIKPTDTFDAVVCNPPFYKNAYEAASKNQKKVKNLNLNESDKSNFSGLSNELWYKGGEVAFIRKMVAESILYKNQVHWFTSLISNKDNVRIVKRAINKTNPTKTRIIDMEQGNKKSRFIAWSFQ
jgi:23S rRNA (adenine1618-N6)-methyltransferase